VNYDNSLVATITVSCYSWAPSSGDYLFSCGAISRPPHIASKRFRKITRSRFSIWFVFRIWRRITPLSFLHEEYTLESDLWNNVFFHENLSTPFIPLLPRHPIFSIS